MGRRNVTYRRELKLVVEVDAPDFDEGRHRLDDTVEVLRTRFLGAEIYRPDDGGPQRIPGRPRWADISEPDIHH